MYLADAEDPFAPRADPMGRVLLALFWLFMMSFAFDFKVRDGSGTSPFHFLFLTGGFTTTACIVLLGFRYISGRPSGWMMLLWASFLLFYFGNAALQGVPPSRFLRTGLPFLLSFFAMLNSHIVASSGIRVAHLAAPILTCVLINISWRMVYGFFFTEGVDLNNVRVEILSPGLNWAAAFIGVSILLRSRLHWTLLLTGFLLFGAILLSVTRALIFPVATSAIATFACYLLGMNNRAYHPLDLPKKLAPFLLAGIAILTFIIGIVIAVPSVSNRWHERLFDQTSDRNMVGDPSLLTRQAEAKAIFTLLDDDPIHYINGFGVGASFYWDDDYFPELYQIYEPEELEEISSDIWYAGHSIWTYSLFSGGLIALAAFITLFVSSIALSIGSAAANSQLPGPDYWLFYLPAVATLCMLSESATSNPFDERLLGIIFGATFGLSQAGYVRAAWLAHQNTTPDTPPPPLIV